MADLEHETHGGAERDTLVTGKRQHLVVVHDGVERFDPHGIDVTIEHDPFGTVVLDDTHVSHDHGEQTCGVFVEGKKRNYKYEKSINTRPFLVLNFCTYLIQLHTTDLTYCVATSGEVHDELSPYCAVNRLHLCAFCAENVCRI